MKYNLITYLKHGKIMMYYKNKDLYYHSTKTTVLIQAI